MEPIEVVELVRQLASGLEAAREAHIIHRDLKPSNVFRHDDVWKILDFGVAKVELAGNTLTAGQLVGTSVYMAPEQASGAAIDHRVDVYALAAIAYRALTGAAPFESAEMADVLFNLVRGLPRLPSALAKLSRDIDDVLALGLAKLPDDRFASATEFAATLSDAVTIGLSETVRSRARRLAARRRLWNDGSTAIAAHER